MSVRLQKKNCYIYGTGPFIREKKTKKSDAKMVTIQVCAETKYITHGVHIRVALTHANIYRRTSRLHLKTYECPYNPNPLLIHIFQVRLENMQESILKITESWLVSVWQELHTYYKTNFQDWVLRWFGNCAGMHFGMMTCSEREPDRKNSNVVPDGQSSQAKQVLFYLNTKYISRSKLDLGIQGIYGQLHYC